MDEQEAFDHLTPFTFAIVAQSKDRQLVSAQGTGFFVAPYTGLTAKHVDEAIWDDLEMPWRKGRYPPKQTEPEYFIKPVQIVDIRCPNEVATWDVTAVTPCNQTDATFLHVTPDNTLAHQLKWAQGFAELELLPPQVGEEIGAFGYPGSRPEFTAGETNIVLNSTPTLVQGQVVEVFEQGRPGWRYPAFRTNARFEHGLSGAPVIHNGKLCGIVSYGATYENDGHGAYAAALWPLLLSDVKPSIDPRQRNAPVLDYLKSGFLKAPGWQGLKQRAYIADDEHGRPYPALR